MTPFLAGLLVMLIGWRLQVRPQRRVPGPPTRASKACDSVDVSGALRLGDRWPVRRPTGLGPEHVAAWCDGLARAVAGGATLATAIRTVEPPAPCVAAVSSIRLALERGASLHDACSSGPHPPDLQVAVTVIQACAAHGGPAAEPLGRTAAVLRGRAADAAERHTQSAQARMSAVVMTVLPIGMLILLLATSASVRSFVASPAGLGVVAVGAALNTLGWRWMRRLVDGSRA